MDIKIMDLLYGLGLAVIVFIVLPFVVMRIFMILRKAISFISGRILRNCFGPLQQKQINIFFTKAASVFGTAMAGIILVLYVLVFILELLSAKYGGLVVLLVICFWLMTDGERMMGRR